MITFKKVILVGTILTGFTASSWAMDGHDVPGALGVVHAAGGARVADELSYDKVAAIADHAAAERISQSNSMYMGGHSPSADSAKARLSELKASRPYPEIYDKVAAIADHAAAEVIAQSNSMYMGGHNTSADSAKARLSELKASRWAMDGHDVPGALGVVHAAGGARVADELSYDKVAAIADHAAAERISQSNSMYMGGHSPSADSAKARLSELKASRPYPEIYDKVAAIADHAAAEVIAQSNSMYMGGHNTSADSAKARLSELKASRPH
jgi:hypothetical protein